MDRPWIILDADSNPAKGTERRLIVILSNVIAIGWPIIIQNLVICNYRFHIST